MEGKFISYHRVSTQKQSNSGLGLEAQAEAVLNYLNGGRWELLGSYVEVESGAKNDRPQLNEALKQCRLTGATLLIAKLDRLSRDAYFLLGLQKSGVRFVCCDMPDANNLTVGVMALVAQQEREMISQRTRAALAAAKARGVKLGCPIGAKHLAPYRKLGVYAIKRNARERAEDLRDTIAAIREAGVTSYSGIARELNRQQIKTPRKGKWHPSSVKRLMTRLG